MYTDFPQYLQFYFFSIFITLNRTIYFTILDDGLKATSLNWKRNYLTLDKLLPITPWFPTLQEYYGG